MGKKCNDYLKALEAAKESQLRLSDGPQQGAEFQQNQADAQNNSDIASTLLSEYQADPEG